MKHAKAVACLALFAVAVALGTGCDREGANAADDADRPSVTDELGTDTVRLARANSAFALELYAELRNEREREGKNLFLSPFSISTVLGMTYAGARGTTARQMYQVLRFPTTQTDGRPIPWEQERLHGSFRRLIGSLKARQEEASYQLSVANALWGQKGYGFRREFLSLIRKHYGAGLQEVDFANDPQGSRKTINTWVEEKTQEKIKDQPPASQNLKGRFFVA